MSNVIYQDFKATIHTAPGDLPSAYIPQGCESPQGRGPYRRRVKHRRSTFAPLGAAFLLLCAASMVAVAWGISALARWVWA